MERQFQDFDSDLLRSALAERNASPVTGEELAAAKAAVLRSTTQPSRARQSADASVRKFSPGWMGYGIAAVALLIGIAKLPGIFHRVGDAPAEKSYITQRGQIAAVTLASGTQVTLAPATTLRVRGNEVDLAGQALFTVKHNASTPFTVRAGNSVTRVLGTTFTVRAYESDNSVRVVVADGRVAVAGSPANGAQSGTSTILSAGDAAQITIAGNVTPIADLNLAEALGWTQGKLVFERAPLRDVLIELERAYNVSFRAADTSLERREVTGTLSANSLNAVIGELTSLLNTRTERNGNTITFHRR